MSAPILPPILPPPAGGGGGPKAQSFALGRWLQRLGWTRPDEPPFDFSVQPVQVVSDVRSLTPEFRGPSAVLGGRSGSSIAQFTVWSLRSRSPGGVILSDLTVFGIAGGPVQAAVSIMPTPPIWGALGPVPVVPQVMQGPFESMAEHGSVALPAPTNLPMFVVATVTSAAVFPFGEGWWIPNGSHLTMQLDTVNVQAGMRVTVQELPASRS